MNAVNASTASPARSSRGGPRPGQATRAARAAQAPARSPRATPDPRLVRLTREVLEGLKHPQAVPSQVIMAALVKAASLSAQ